jgi:hypothetical protein
MLWLKEHFEDICPSETQYSQFGLGLPLALPSHVALNVG